VVKKIIYKKGIEKNLENLGIYDKKLKKVKNVNQN
jgi:hypothetical protein